MAYNGGTTFQDGLSMHIGEYELTPEDREILQATADYARTAAEANQEELDAATFASLQREREIRSTPAPKFRF